MAKNFSQEFRAHLDQEVLTLCTCWQIKLRDGRQFGFTDVDRNIWISPTVYYGNQGFDKTAVRNAADATVQNLDLASILSVAGVNLGDLISGDFDGAEMLIFYINYAAPPLQIGVEPFDYCPVAIGTLGEVKTDGISFTATFRGWLDRFNKASTWLTSRTCRHRLGDSRCRVNTALFTVETAIAQVIDARNFILATSAPATANLFANGELTFLGGLSTGSVYQVQSYTADRLLTLYEPVRRAITDNTPVSIVWGCNLTPGDCYSKFNNIANYGGEPHVPGWDAVATGKGSPGTSGSVLPPPPPPPPTVVQPD